jgi:hypothetical protein
LKPKFEPVFSKSVTILFLVIILSLAGIYAKSYGLLSYNLGVGTITPLHAVVVNGTENQGVNISSTGQINTSNNVIINGLRIERVNSTTWRLTG